VATFSRASEATETTLGVQLRLHREALALGCRTSRRDGDAQLRDEANYFRRTSNLGECLRAITRIWPPWQMSAEWRWEREPQGAFGRLRGLALSPLADEVRSAPTLPAGLKVGQVVLGQYASRPAKTVLTWEFVFLLGVRVVLPFAAPSGVVVGRA